MWFELHARGVALRARTTGDAVRWRLHEVVLSCAAGERIGVIGANGAGKSSLARVLCGLERPTRGHVRVRPRGCRVMLVLQRPEEHFVARTVHEELGGYVRHPLDAQAAARLLAAVGLPPGLATQPPRLLSAGQQRAVALACGLASGPSMLILDEPLGSLDAEGRRQVLRSLRFLSEDHDACLCVISHHPDDLLGWARRLWVLADGRLVHDGDFRRAPVAALERAMDPGAPSLYLALRRIEERGVRLPPAVYDGGSAREIARLLEEATDL